MKFALGIVVAMLCLGTMALAQGYQLGSPFPQAANPALQNGAQGADLASTAIEAYGESPAAMASNGGAAWHRGAELGSPFPSAADPALGSTSSDQSAGRSHFGGSPFPVSANPSHTAE